MSDDVYSSMTALLSIYHLSFGISNLQCVMSRTWKIKLKKKNSEKRINLIHRWFTLISNSGGGDNFSGLYLYHNVLISLHSHWHILQSAKGLVPSFSALETAAESTYENVEPLTTTEIVLHLWNEIYFTSLLIFFFFFFLKTLKTQERNWYLELKRNLHFYFCKNLDSLKRQVSVFRQNW